jgi:ferric hydroxamate transport system substrate-binding protein
MRKLVTVVAALAATLALGACGSSEPAASDTPSNAAAQPVSVTDSRNKKVDLKGPATKVVALEWGAAENLVTLGVMPVGVADTKGYGHWVKDAPLDPSVKDVGTRGEVSVDSVVALDPDLVIAVREDTKAIAQLEKYVPVLVVRGADRTKPIEQMKTNLKMVASATGKTAEADKALADFDQEVAAGKQELATARFTGKPFTMADGYKQGSTISIRMYGAGSLLGAVGAELGLKPAWTKAGDVDYDLSSTDIEGVTKLGDVHFFYIANNADGGDVFTADLAKNAIWKKLPFVLNGKVHRLPDGIWMFGGPKSTARFVDEVVKVLTS